MNPELRKAIGNLEGIASVKDPEELQKLDVTVRQLFSCRDAKLGIDALLRVFERFPDDDGYGIFWAILHGLESLPGYEERLIESVRRRPSRFGLLMVNRMLNGGIAEANGVDLSSLLKEVAAREGLPESVREEARIFVGWQESNR